jgi:sugar phosphate permease
LIATIGVLIFLFLKENTTLKSKKTSLLSRKEIVKNYITAIKIPSVWLLMVIVLCSYVGYKVTDIFSLYANEVMGYNEVDSAKIGTLLLYIRPVIGVVIGLLADRAKAGILMILGFLIMIFGSLLLASGIIETNTTFLFFFAIIIVSVGVYAFRTLYFAAMQEGFIPLAITGTAVGLISLIGYTPDIFAGPAIGYLLDTFPGEKGHQYVFVFLSVFAVIGLVASVSFNIISSTKKNVYHSPGTTKS